MNIIKEAIEYTKKKWNTLTLSTKLNNFYTLKNINYDKLILEYKETLLKCLQEGDMQRALDAYNSMIKWKNNKVNIEEFKKYIEQENNDN